MWKVLIALFALSLAAQAQAQTQAHAHASDLREITGLKYPNDPGEGQGPVPTTALALKAGAKAEGFTELLEFALRAPDQEEAGSCLYMSLTGIAEWWLAKLNPRASRGPEGPLDLSERYLMNIAGIEENENGIPNWKTDSIFLFNQHGSTLLNRDYRFAKGWYAYDAEGNIFRANADTPGAVYDAYYSWIDERETVTTATRIRLPRFTREVLFADPASNQWNTGVMPADRQAEPKLFICPKSLVALAAGLLSPVSGLTAASFISEALFLSGASLAVPGVRERDRV